MEPFDSSAPRPLVYIPSIPIFDPLEFDRSLPSSQYTLIKTDDLRMMYKEIGRVQAYLHNLIHHGDAAQLLAIDDSKEAKPAAAAVECIPPEILSMIFEQLLPTQDNDLTPIQIPELKEILLPGQICKSWREAAIATPALWSSLQFNFNNPKNIVERMVHMATTCIARAKNYPLFISYKTWYTDLTRYRPVIAVLFAHSNQWHNLFIDSTGSAHEELWGAKGRLSMLYKLKVDYGQIKEWGSFDTFLTLPNLRILDLCNYGFQPWYEIGQFPSLPWRQLQQIAFVGQARDALELLRMSPSLQVFKVSLVGHSERLHHVHHAFLRELSVEGLPSDSDAIDLFGEVTLPALVSLSYAGEAFPRDAITSFVQRSKIEQSLHTFCLTLHKRRDTPLIPSSDISDCLERMPCLSQLSLHDLSNRYTDTGPFHSGDISSICELLRPRSILPKLKRFSITGPPQMSCIYLALMVGSRWRHAAGGLMRIQSVEINYSRPCAHAK
ncbi:hypothetical protein FIBSPDRAFT_379343 [Athelia psychrophila]|uniref:Uncharacterized protein n=1 Tax=Athelia psychrophila TaxID=1759441 RepID=A0A166P3A7_9AGAM|nr:hypothetical protein FIBSPDRAFT_379343 [Fibularhizoctonia sp. CBS 109695]